MPPRVRQIIGVATHKAAEVNLGQKIESKTDLPLDDVLDVYSTTFDTDAADIEKPEEPIGSAKDSGAKLVKLHRLELSPQIDPVAVEKPVKFQVNGREYSTTLDLVDRKPDGRNGVRELKTSMRTPDGAQHLFQVVGGALGLRQETGKTEAELRVDVLLRQKLPRIHKIVWGPMSNATIGVFANQIAHAEATVRSGAFLANGLHNGSCSWCGYTSICPAFKAAFGNRL